MSNFGDYLKKLKITLLPLLNIFNFFGLSNPPWNQLTTPFEMEHDMKIISADKKYYILMLKNKVAGA